MKENNTTNKIDIRERASQVRSLLLRGDVTYQEAVDMLAPEVAKANSRIKDIAKEFGMKAKLIDIKSLLR